MQKKMGYIGKRIKKDFKKNKAIYLMLLPVVAWYVIFCYMPMYGVVISFKDYMPHKGILGSPWADNFGFENFIEFFSSKYCGRIIKNTIMISVWEIVLGFPAPIIFAIFLSELQNQRFKKVVQTITYLPHFVTTVVICGIIKQFTNSEGLITAVVNFFTGHEGSLLTEPSFFRPIYVISGIWSGFGWGSIVYLAAIIGVGPELYEAAAIDGASRLKCIRYITIPSIIPTVTIMLILKIGGIMSVGWEKAFLLQNAATYETSDIISTYVYRKGFQDMSYSFSSAVGLVNSVINIILVVIANKICKKVTETSLW